MWPMQSEGSLQKLTLYYMQEKKAYISPADVCSSEYLSFLYSPILKIVNEMKTRLWSLCFFSSDLYKDFSG